MNVEIRKLDTNYVHPQGVIFKNHYGLFLNNNAKPEAIASTVSELKTVAEILKNV